MSGFTLCRLADLPSDGARGFSIPIPQGTVELFVIRQGGDVYGYVNSCPHTGAPLNWSPDVFLDTDRLYIQCANHDALFTIDEGLCIAGPCPGAQLTAVSVEIAGDLVLLSVNR